MTRFASALAFIICLWGLGVGGAQFSVHAEPVGDWTAAEPALAADSLLLDQYPNANAAYSLRKLRSDHDGPVVRVRRSSDGAEQDFGFANDDFLDVSAVESWLGSSDGYVTTWYAQVSGTPDLTQSNTGRQPRIAQGGTVETGRKGYPMLYIDTDDYMEATGFSTPLNQNDYIMWGVLQPDLTTEEIDEESTFGIGTLASKHWETASYRMKTTYVNNSGITISDVGLGYSSRSMVAMRNTGSKADIWQGHVKKHQISDSGLSTSNERTAVSIGAGGGLGPKYKGHMGEVAFYPSGSEQKVVDLHINVTADWEVGPTNWNENALLPQNRTWMVDLYDWLETVSIPDVTLNPKPGNGSITHSTSNLSDDELADLWLKTRHLTSSSVTRHIPNWYVLDDGNGKGIEATGTVKANHEPNGPGQYEGNPPRSWQNEPALWYDLHIPDGGSEGNPWKGDDAMARRAMIVSAVDLMMHQEGKGGFNDAMDMKGKAYLGMAEAYKRAGDVLPQGAEDAYLTGMERLTEDLRDRGPKGANTNMGMFALNGATMLYTAVSDQALKDKCVQLVKRALFGYEDGSLNSKHQVFSHKSVGTLEGGVFDPSGFIMEGDQAEVFYGGESINHIMGALQNVTDRSTGNVPSDWQFLEEVVRRLQEWRTYQQFHDPRRKSGGTVNSLPVPTAGASMSGRTSYGVPNGQSFGDFVEISIADRWSDFAYKAGGPIGSNLVLTPSDMKTDISDALSTMNNRFSDNYTGGPANDWGGFSPWTKKTPYLPPEGWYSDLKSLDNNDDPNFEKWPSLRSGTTWNKALGGTAGGAETVYGDEIGKQYWSYKDTDSNGEAFGFFVEAHALQGNYGGWYGGKIETFWTESTGVLLIGRKGKSGCDRSGVDDYSGSEDSKCWFNLDEKAGHHVWGRDENNNGFSTLLLRGRQLSRTATFDDPNSPTTVTVQNDLTDNSAVGNGGEETGSELQGSVQVENKFEVQSNGLKVTHSLTSDQTDDVNELWASIPVYLRHNNPHRAGNDVQSGMNDTKIEYWNGSSWVEVPYDTDSDGVPEIVTTDALRLGRDYEDGQGFRYGYVSFPSSQDVRRSKHKYYDPYQSKTGVRTLHIDLHGNPGNTKTIPGNESVSYTIQTTDPTA